MVTFHAQPSSTRAPRLDSEKNDSLTKTLRCCSNTSVDMWAAGCVLGEMLLHQPLFAGKDQGGIFFPNWDDKKADGDDGVFQDRGWQLIGKNRHL